MENLKVVGPDQVALINDLVFDVTGVPVSINELVILTLGFIAVRMIFKSPLCTGA